MVMEVRLYTTDLIEQKVPIRYEFTSGLIGVGDNNGLFSIYISWLSFIYFIDNHYRSLL